MTKSNKKIPKSHRNYSLRVTLGYGYISRLTWAYRKEIVDALDEVRRIKNLDEIISRSKVLTSIALHPLYENLSVLEPLIVCYLGGRDGKTFETCFNDGDGQLYDLLKEIRKFIKQFPPSVEQFYQNYSAYRERLLAKSPVCKICNERGANMHYSNAIIHEQCLGKVKAKYCEYCANLYLNNEEKCANKAECEKYQLKDTVASKGRPYDAVSMKIPLETINEAKRETQESHSHYKGGN